MKKLLFALLAVSLSLGGLTGVSLCGCAAAEAGRKPPAGVKVGFLAKLNITEEEYRDLVVEERKSVGWQLMPENRGGGERFVFYDSLMAMQMALERGDIDEAALPKAVGEYVLNTVPKFTVACVTRVKPIFLAFGFRNDEIRDRFNEALSTMKRDGTLLALQEKYLSNPGMGEPEPVKMERYDGAEAVRVVVTGDLPPIDFVTADGKLAGFNTAVLAEIGKRLHLNVEAWDSDTGARTAALASGRADAVFWYQYAQDAAQQVDVPEGVLLSEPYYNWDKFLHLRKK